MHCVNFREEKKFRLFYKILELYVRIHNISFLNRTERVPLFGNINFNLSEELSRRMHVTKSSLSKKDDTDRYGFK